MGARVMIDVRNVGKAFGNLRVLHEVSLEVCAGEVVVVIGPSGSGKTTLLRCLNFLEDYDLGEVYFDGHLVGYRDMNGKRVPDSQANIAAVRAQMGMVFQHFHLWPHKTVLENVIEGPRIVRRIAARTAAERGPCPARQGGLVGQGRCLPQQDLGWSDAACSDRARSRHGAEGALALR